MRHDEIAAALIRGGLTNQGSESIESIASRPAYKLGPAKEYGPAFGMREGSPVPTWPMQYVFNFGGLGDFVNYAAATIWIAKNCPWIEGRLFVQTFLVPLMQEIHKEFKHWRVYPAEQAGELLVPGMCVLDPGGSFGSKTPQYLSAMGAHQIEVAFAHYAGVAPAPADAFLPVLDFSRRKLPLEVAKLGPYCVIPTGFSSPNRSLSGRHLNSLIRYIKSKGITPVFLGKRDFVGNQSYITRFPNDIAYAEGLDMREKTDVIAAARIMQHAEFTVGLDCGLLHLAALMKDSKIIFGYNVTNIAHREPRRKHGKTINIALTKEELVCSGCQSHWRNFPKHTFNHCYYGDNKCVELLFANDAERFKHAVDEILEVA